jgi:hypothetical protein
MMNLFEFVNLIIFLLKSKLKWFGICIPFENHATFSKTIFMRKIILLSLVLFFSAIQLSAQFQKNEIYGGLSYGRRLFDYNTNNYKPSFSIGLNTHSTIGVFLDNTRYNVMPSQFYDGYSRSLGFGLSYDYAHYFKKSTKWGWYVNSSLGFYKFKEYEKQNGITTLNTEYNQQELSVTPGIFFRASPRILFYGNIGGIALTNNRYEFKGRLDMVRQLNIGVTISLGNPGKKKK